MNNIVANTLTAEMIETNERCQAEAYGLIRSDHWIVCSGKNVVSPLLPSLEEARLMAEKLVVPGSAAISIHHVGVPQS